MNDINRKNAVYQMNPTASLPYTDIENVEHNGSQLNSVVVNNAFRQLTDNDLILQNSLARLNSYQPGPDDYNIEQIEESPNGYKVWKNEANTDLSILRKVDKDLSACLVQTNLTSDIVNVFEYGGTIFAIANEAANNLYICNNYDGQTFDQVDLAGAPTGFKINNYCLFEDGVVFATNKGVYCLSCYSKELDDGDTTLAYAVKSIENPNKAIPTDDQDCCAVVVDESAYQLYVGTTTKKIYSGFFNPNVGPRNVVSFTQNLMYDLDDSSAEVESPALVNNFGIIRHSDYSYDADTFALTESGLYQTGDTANVLQQYSQLPDKTCYCSIYIADTLLIGTNMGVYKQDGTPLFSEQLTNRKVTQMVQSGGKLYVVAAAVPNANPQNIVIYNVVDGQFVYDQTISTGRTINGLFIYSTIYDDRVLTYPIIWTQGGIYLVGFPETNDITPIKEGIFTSVVMNPGSLVIYYIKEGENKLKGILLYGLSRTATGGINGLVDYQTPADISGPCKKILMDVALFSDRIVNLKNGNAKSPTDVGGTTDDTFVDFCKLSEPLTIDGIRYGFIGVSTNALFAFNSSLSSIKLICSERIPTGISKITDSAHFIVIKKTSGEVLYKMKSKIFDANVSWTSLGTNFSDIDGAFTFLWTITGSTVDEYAESQSQAASQFKADGSKTLEASQFIDSLHSVQDRLVVFAAKKNIYLARYSFGDSLSVVRNVITAADDTTSDEILSISYSITSKKGQHILHVVMNNGSVDHYQLAFGDTEISCTKLSESTAATATTKSYIDDFDTDSYLIGTDGIYSYSDATQTEVSAEVKGLASSDSLLNYTALKIDSTTLIANTGSKIGRLSDAFNFSQIASGSFANLNYQTATNYLYFSTAAADSPASISAMSLDDKGAASIKTIISSSTTTDANGQTTTTTADFKVTDFISLNNLYDNPPKSDVILAISGLNVYTITSPDHNLSILIDSKTVNANLGSSSNLVHIDAMLYDGDIYVLLVANVSGKYRVVRYVFDNGTMTSDNCRLYNYTIYTDDETSTTSAYHDYTAVNYTGEIAAHVSNLSGADSEQIFFATTPDSVYYKNGNSVYQCIQSNAGCDATTEAEDDWSVGYPIFIEHKFDLGESVKATTFKRDSAHEIFIGIPGTNGCAKLAPTEDDTIDDDSKFYDTAEKDSPELHYPELMFSEKEFGQVIAQTGDSALTKSHILSYSETPGGLTETTVYSYAYDEGKTTKTWNTEFTSSAKYTRAVKAAVAMTGNLVDSTIFACRTDGRTIDRIDVRYCPGSDSTSEPVRCVVAYPVISFPAETVSIVNMAVGTNNLYVLTDDKTIRSYQLTKFNDTGDNQTINALNGIYQFDYSATPFQLIPRESYVRQYSGQDINVLEKIIGLNRSDINSPVYWIADGKDYTNIIYQIGEVDKFTKTGTTETGTETMFQRISSGTDDTKVARLESTATSTKIVSMFDGAILATIPESANDFRYSGSMFAFKSGTGTGIKWKLLINGELAKIDGSSAVVSFCDVGYDTVVALGANPVKGIKRIDFEYQTTLRQEDINKTKMQTIENASRLVGYAYGTDDVNVVCAVGSTSLELNHYSYQNDKVESLPIKSGDRTLQPSRIVFDSGVMNGNVKVVIAGEGAARDIYYGKELNNLATYPDKRVLNDHTVNSVDTVGDYTYLLTDDGIMYTTGYSAVMKFIKVKNLFTEGNEPDCHTVHPLGDGQYLLTTDKGMYFLNNVRTGSAFTLQARRTSTPESSTWPVASYSTTADQTTYLYPVVASSEKSIRYSKNARRWKQFINLTKLTSVSKIHALYVKDDERFYIGTDNGLYTVKGQYDLVNDIKKLSEDDLKNIYAGMGSELNAAYSAKEAAHVNGYHGGIMLTINSLLSTDFTGFDKNWTESSEVGSTQFIATQDVCYTCEFGDQSSDLVSVKGKNFFETEFQDLDFSYILKKYDSNASELYVNIPTTHTYYIAHSKGVVGCGETSEDHTTVRPNLVGIYDYPIDSKMSTKCTKFSISVKKSCCRFTQVIAVLANGTSLPLKIYQDYDHYSTSEQSLAAEGQAALMYHSFIEPTLYVGKSSTASETTFNFVCFGTDAQSVKIMFID